MAKNNKERVFGRTEMYRHKLEENRDKKEHSPYTPTFFGVGLVTVVCFMLLFGGMGVASATDWSAPVPDNHIQPLTFEVADWRTLSELKQQFEAEHRYVEENDYNGDGSWGDGYGEGDNTHPRIRDTGRYVLGYIDAYRVTGKNIYKQRAKEGLEYLLREQNEDGHFTWWCPLKYSPSGRCHGHGAILYETGIAGSALVEGYKFFGDERYLNAAKKAAQCQHGQLAGNANYNMFGAWLEAGVYEITGDKYYLDGAVKHALYGIRDNSGRGHQLPSGGWSDSHNQGIIYQGVIIRGLVKLLSVMPESHPNYDDIEKATYKAVNHLRLRQTEDGKWLKKPSDSAEHYWSRHCAMAISMAGTELNWPVKDSLRCASKTGGDIMGTGSMLRAYSGAPPPPPPSTGTISGTVRELAQLLKSLFLNKIH